VAEDARMAAVFSRPVGECLCTPEPQEKRLVFFTIFNPGRMGKGWASQFFSRNG
jgi:hypothetical protein